jgi:uncharacterized membrane protein
MTNLNNTKMHFLFASLEVHTVLRALKLLMPCILALFFSALAVRLYYGPSPYVAQYEAQASFWVWLHLGTVVPGTMLGLYQLWQPKGTPRHRLLGKIWCALMVITALAALMIRGYFLPNWHGINPIHIFSVMTLVGVPKIIITAKRHQIVDHQRAVFGLCLGGLFIAGLFTFLPGRLLGSWLFGS